jgi:predicted amidohydrolase
VVRRSEGEGREQVLASTFFEYLPDVDGGDESFVIPDTRARFLLKKSKTRIHELEGRAGLDFLQAVRASFSAAASERRAFLGDVDRLTTEIESLQLFEDGHEKMNRLPRLRDADRYTLRRFIATSLVQGLERYALLLDPHEAAVRVREHTQRLLAIVNSDFVVEDFDFVRALLRVAVLCQDGDLIRTLRNWLRQWTRDLAEGAVEVSWKSRILPRRPALEATVSYLNSRVLDSIASSCPWDGGTLEDLESFREGAAILRAADLRYLPREVDVLRFGTPPVENLPLGADDPVLKRAASRDRGLRERLGSATKFLTRCAELGETAWENVGSVSLLLSAYPPSYADVARRFLARMETRKTLSNVGREIDLCVNALRGTRYHRVNEQAIRISNASSVVSLGLGDQQPSANVRLILSSLPVDDTAFEAAARGTPQLTFERLRRLDHGLREARIAVREAKKRGVRSLLVMPELSLPRLWFLAMMEFASREDIAVVSGLEYERIGQTVANQAAGVFPLGLRAAAVVMWTKRYPARHEASFLRALGVSFRSPPAGHRRLVIDSAVGRLGVLICSELLESSALSALTGHVEMVLVPAWNDDTSSFNHLTHAAASALVHAFVGVANNAEASDSRVVAPIKEPRHERDWCRLIQRGESRVVWGDLPVAELRSLHESNGVADPANERIYRPLPPDWPEQGRDD